MKIILVFVSTLDGKVTKWGNAKVSLWTSKEDKEYFRKIWKDANLIVMGSNTYRAGDLPSWHHLLVVMTRDPSQYKDKAVAHHIEFTDDSPVKLVERFEKEGFEQMMLVGGPQIATSFLQEQLVDEIWLTIEPKIFGSGGNFTVGVNLDIDLSLISCEKVNKQGTLIAKYAIQHPG